LDRIFVGDGGSLDDQDEAYLDFDDDDHDSDNDDAYDDDENDDMDSRIANAMAENSLSLDGKYKAREYIPGLCDGDDFDDDLVDAASDSNQSPTNKNRDSNHQPNYRLVSSSTIGMTCSGCGSPFQSKNVLRPGFLPSDIFAKEDDRLRTLKREGVISGSVEIGGEGGGEEAADWSADDEVDWLVNGAQQQQEQQQEQQQQQPQAVEHTSAADLDALITAPPPICKRCYTLKYNNLNTLPAELQPTTYNEDLQFDNNLDRAGERVSDCGRS